MNQYELDKHMEVMVKESELRTLTEWYGVLKEMSLFMLDKRELAESEMAMHLANRMDWYREQIREV